MGFFLRWQNIAFIVKLQIWNFVCGIRRSFAFTMENFLSVWYTATPGWTSKFGKVWKTRCQNAATRANIWRCFLVLWEDKYLWVMGSKNRPESYFCIKLLCFSSIHCFFGQIRYQNIRHDRTLTSSPLMLKCSERWRASGTQEQEYPPPLPLGTADPATVRRGSNPRIIGDHPGAGVPTRWK